ncbi:hypothetical protein [Amycolatopsis lexingtonensis]|uniref:hypothetical protein n=1 Tax=Amycolatopsis lexingtonensis TaxID=218822 RepID=UPI003F6ECD34
MSTYTELHTAWEEQQATIAELETTIDGLADLNKELESELERAVGDLDALKDVPLRLLSESIDLIIRNLKGAHDQ